MFKEEFKFVICSPVDREKLTCEIYFKNEIIAEISQESKELMIELYPTQSCKWWTVSFDDFQMALNKAKHILSNEK